MTIGAAIRECKRRHNIKDEQIALWTDATAQTVYQWCTDRSSPNARRYQRLRQHLPDFAALMDEATQNGARHAS